MPDNKATIIVDQLEKSFKNVEVLKGISFAVEKGSIFALLGSNGAGKTTTIKILTTLSKADRGSAQICGFDVAKKPEQVRENISLTGQNAAVDEILTGRENMVLIGKLRHLSDIKEKSDALLARFELLDAADRSVSTYSGGMRRRLDLAMSLLANPPVIFLDEPTTGLDPQARITMWKIIKDLAHSGITVFLTTQYLEEAEQLADQIAILHEGKIVTQGSAAELKSQLPRGHIELRFHRQHDLLAANTLLAAYDSKADEESLTLLVATDGSVKHITQVLSQFEHAGIEIAEFSQKQPTLEDVFLSIVSVKSAKEGQGA